MSVYLLAGILLGTLAAPIGAATIRGDELALKSEAFAGTHVWLDAAGELAVTVDSPQSGGVVVIVADHRELLEPRGPAVAHFSLPAGMYFVRLQPAEQNANLAVRGITIEGATPLPGERRIDSRR